MSRDVERQLAGALAQPLRGGVSGVGLAAAARVRAQRIRRRRRAGGAAAAVAVVVVGAPLAVALVGQQPPAAVLAPTAAPSVQVDPHAELQTALAQDLTAPTSFPDEATLLPEDLGTVDTAFYDLEMSLAAPLTAGQRCDPEPDLPPLVRRDRSWGERASNAPTYEQVELVLAGWVQDDVRPAWQRLVAGGGDCPWAVPPTAVDAGDLPGQDTWAATFSAGAAPEAARARGAAAVRMGDVVVLVTVAHPDGEQAAVTRAQQLVAVAAERTAAALG